jgi:hypothetical protein
MRLKKIQEEIEKLSQDKNSKISAQEGQGRGILAPLIQGKQKKIADEYDGRMAPLELQKKHLLERRQLSVAIISTIIGAILGVIGTATFSALTNTAPKSTLDNPDEDSHHIQLDTDMPDRATDK